MSTPELPTEIVPGDPRYPAFRAVGLTVLAFCLYLLVPGHFYGSLRNLDPAFQIALQMSFQQGLVWGRDTIFSYGPLSFLSTRLPFAGVHLPLLLFDLFLYSHLLFICWYAVRASRTPTAVWCLGLAFFIFTPDFYFLDLSIVLLALQIFFMLHFLEHERAPALLSAACFSILAFYLKSNSGVLALILFAGTLLCWALDRRRLAAPLLTLLAYAGAIFLSSIVIGVDLPGYLRGAIHIIVAYNDAMFLEPEGYESYLYMGAAVLVGYALWALAHARSILSSCKSAFQAGVVAIATFMLFKQAFVRADEHIVVFFKYVCLPLGSLYLFVPKETRRGLGLVVFLALMGAVAQSSNRNKLPSPAEKLSGLGNYLSEAAAGDKDGRPSEVPKEDRLPDDILNELRKGTVDVMPQHSQLIYYNRLRYAPRPMHMSWNVWDRYIDELNAAYFASPEAPDHVIVAIFMSGYYAFEFESRTKLELLARYDLWHATDQLLFLKKRSAPLKLTLSPPKRARVSIGGEIAIDQPAEGGLGYIALRPRLTLPARLRRFVFQPPGLDFTFLLSQGDPVKWGIGKPMLENGMLASHYVREPSEYAAFFGRRFDGLRKVKSVKLDARLGWGFESEMDTEQWSVRISE